MHYSDLKLHSSWISAIGTSRYQGIMEPIVQQLQQIPNNHIIFPPHHTIFKALELTPFEQTKVVILGQDPYHGTGQAHGLAFSIPSGIPFPPSLRNILKELQADLQLPFPTSGDLSPWAKQGVLLLNTILTVEKDKPASHQSFGWQKLTDAIIQSIAEHKKHTVFILWGSHAQQKKSLITGNHLILESVHPSPLSAHRGFFGSKPFSKTNDFLRAHDITAIDWNLATPELFT